MTTIYSKVLPLAIIISHIIYVARRKMLDTNIISNSFFIVISDANKILKVTSFILYKGYVTLFL